LSLKREQATTYQSAAETKFSVAQKMCADYNNKLTKISSEIKSLEINLNLINKFLNSLPDGCPTCGQDLPDPDRDRLNVEKINEKNICENKLKELIVEKNKLSEELKVFNESKKTLSDVIFECRKKIGVFDSEMFKLRSEITKLSSVKPPKESEVILETIKGLENRITDKLSEINPYISLLKNVELEEIDKKNELEIKNKELDNAKEDLPYREFIVKLFGDDGVRKYVVDNSIPTLNSRISYWLGILCGGRLKLFFNNSFDEFVDKYPFDGKKYDYHGLSNGQRRRLVLALSQAFSYLMAVTSGSSLNIVFFDEVSLNIDAAGVEAISRMIGEVAKDRQVILVDHNQDLLSSFDGSDQINVLMKNGSSELVESF
jgi:DNA repair exonuclease SbcCD ATPase subunit